MSSVLDPSALAESPLADLHLLANELGVDGYRRLRKADLIDAILAGRPARTTSPPAPPWRRRGRRHALRRGRRLRAPAPRAPRRPRPCPP